MFIRITYSSTVPFHFEETGFNFSGKPDCCKCAMEILHDQPLTLATKSSI